LSYQYFIHNLLLTLVFPLVDMLLPRPYDREGLYVHDNNGGMRISTRSNYIGIHETGNKRETSKDNKITQVAMLDKNSVV
jgi:hypothetical protein